MPTRLTPRFDAAVALARDLHDGQVRKGTETPYLSHLLAVASIVLEAGGSEDEAIAALLHDAAEDAGGRATLATIRERFGDEVAAIVDACTDTYEEPKPDWSARKQAYLAHLEDPATTDGALLRLARRQAPQRPRDLRSTCASTATRCGSASAPAAAPSCGTTAPSPTCSCVAGPGLSRRGARPDGRRHRAALPRRRPAPARRRARGRPAPAGGRPRRRSAARGRAQTSSTPTGAPQSRCSTTVAGPASSVTCLSPHWRSAAMTG